MGSSRDQIKAFACLLFYSVFLALVLLPHHSLKVCKSRLLCAKGAPAQRVRDCHLTNSKRRALKASKKPETKISQAESIIKMLQNGNYSCQKCENIQVLNSYLGDNPSVATRQLPLHKGALISANLSCGAVIEPMRGTQSRKVSK